MGRSQALEHIKQKLETSKTPLEMSSGQTTLTQYAEAKPVDEFASPRQKTPSSNGKREFFRNIINDQCSRKIINMKEAYAARGNYNLMPEP